MRWVLLLVGLLIGFVSGAGTIIYLQDRNKDTSEMAIVFAPKNYYENQSVVMVSGHSPAKAWDTLTTPTASPASKTERSAG